MRFAFFSLLIGCSLSAFAKVPPDTVMLAIQIEENGKVVASPQMVLAFGKKGSISEKKDDKAAFYFVEILPEKKDGMVQLDLLVNRVQGKTTELVSKARYMTVANEPISIERHTAGLAAIKVTVKPML